MVLRQARQDYIEALEQIERGDALLRQPGTGRFDVKSRRLRESQRAQRLANERSTKALPATVTTSGTITAAHTPEGIPHIPEAEIQTFTWQQKRPPRR